MFGKQKLVSVSDFEKLAFQPIAMASYSAKITDKPTLHFLKNVILLKDFFCNSFMDAFESQKDTSFTLQQSLQVLAFHAFGAGAYITMSDAKEQVIDDLNNTKSQILISNLFEKGAYDIGLESIWVTQDSNNKKVIDHVVISSLNTIVKEFSNELECKRRKDYQLILMRLYFNLGVTFALKRIDVYKSSLIK